jgi:hypothetical protein
MSLLDPLLDYFARLFGVNPPPTTAAEDPPRTVSPRVLVLNYDPIVDGQGTRLSAKMGWNDIQDLIPRFIADLRQASYGLVDYRSDPADRIELDEFPRKRDGFQYTAASYLAVMQNKNTPHDPDGVDYGKIVADHHLIERVTSGEIDEVWLFGAPYFGYWESHMAGKGAVWCNSEPLANSERCPRRFVIMGFNYERGAAEMLHDMGHRMESILAYVYHSFGVLQAAYNSAKPNPAPGVGPEKFTNPKNDFEHFMLFDKIAPGRAEMGLLHTPPNAGKDYDWQNSNFVSSNCDDWLNYPDFRGRRRAINADEWGWGADGYNFNKWWFRHVPHTGGSRNGILNNWWDYTIRVDQPFRGRR